MDLTAISTLVGTIGFPIVCCLMMFKHMEKESENHKAEIKAMTTALERNTEIMTKMNETLSHNTLATEKMSNILMKGT